HKARVDGGEPLTEPRLFLDDFRGGPGQPGDCAHSDRWWLADIAQGELELIEAGSADPYPRGSRGEERGGTGRLEQRFRRGRARRCLGRSRLGGGPFQALAGLRVEEPESDAELLAKDDRERLDLLDPGWGRVIEFRGARLLHGCRFRVRDSAGAEHEARRS